jgi:hypothetical protein
MNKDEDPAETESFKPPPKMDDLMRKNSQTMQSAPQFQPPAMNQVPMQAQQMHNQQIPQQQIMNHAPMQNVMPQQIQQPVQQQQQPQNPQPIQSNVADQGGAPPMPAAPNMFKMQKGRSMSSYSVFSIDIC